VDGLSATKSEGVVLIVRVISFQDFQLYDRYPPTWGKVACWGTKPAISLKRVKVDEKLLLRTYRNSPTLFQTVPSPTPYGFSFPKIGVRKPNLKLQSLLSQERVKLRTSNLAGTFIGFIRRKAHEKFCRKGSVAVSRDCQFFENPLLSRERVKLRTSNLVRAFVWSIGSSVQNLIKNFGKRSSRGRTQGLSKIFRASIYRAHRAVTFAVARLSCYHSNWSMSIRTNLLYNLIHTDLWLMRESFSGCASFRTTSIDSSWRLPLHRALQ